MAETETTHISSLELHAPPGFFKSQKKSELGARVEGAGGFLIQIRSQRGLSLDQARKRTAERLDEIKRLFGRQTDFYYGTVADNSQCLKEMGAIGSEFLGGVGTPFNDSYAPISCNIKEPRYLGSIRFYYCASNQTLYNVKVFGTSEYPESTVSIHCAGN